MTLGAILMMTFSIVFLWGGLDYFIMRAFKSRSNNKQ
ncbi:MetS family NSS transporter small subunit [Fredinandcohnia sp. QZ13]